MSDTQTWEAVRLAFNGRDPHAKIWPAERMVKRYFEAQGWHLSKLQILDFAAYRSSQEQCFVEVKLYGDRLSADQFHAIEFAQRVGIFTSVAVVYCRHPGHNNGICDEAEISVVKFEDMLTEANSVRLSNPRLANALRMVLRIPSETFWGVTPAERRKAARKARAA